MAKKKVIRSRSNLNSNPQSKNFFNKRNIIILIVAGIIAIPILLFFVIMPVFLFPAFSLDSKILLSPPNCENGIDATDLPSNIRSMVEEVTKDNDGVSTISGDNAPGIYNAAQTDSDSDCIGDAADILPLINSFEKGQDNDRDGIPNSIDDKPNAKTNLNQNGKLILPEMKFIRGDRNKDNKVDMSDAYTIMYDVFYNRPIPCQDAADVNDDGIVDRNDIMDLYYWYYQGSKPAPKAPYPNLGIDTTPDELTCEIPHAFPDVVETIQTPPSQVQFIRGDVNGDGIVNYIDANNIASGIYNCDDAADANDDGVADSSDASYIFVFFYSGGPPPKAPYPAKGLDPTPDELGCESYP